MLPRSRIQAAVSSSSSASSSCSMSVSLRRRKSGNRRNVLQADTLSELPIHAPTRPHIRFNPKFTAMP